MINNHIVQRRSGEDRRKKTDRRSGFDRRIDGLGNGFNGENGHDIVYTTKEACEYLKISRPTYLKYIAEGRIKAIKVGRGWRTLKTELDRVLRGE
jgi:excisionase family DNA binding protein